MMNAMRILWGFAAWLACIGVALAQANSIDNFEVAEQAARWW